MAANPEAAFRQALDSYVASVPQQQVPQEDVSASPLSLNLGGSALNLANTQAKLDLAKAEQDAALALQEEGLNAYDTAIQNLSSAYGVGQGSDKGYGTKYGLEPTFWQRIGAANTAMKAAGLGTFTVTSGFRTHAQQKKLYAQKGKTGLVARPGKSKHEYGVAVDLNLNKRQLRWLQKNAKRFGLYQPMSYEPWHWQPL